MSDLDYYHNHSHNS